MGLTDDVNRWSLNVQSVGALYPYSINPENLQHLKTHCALDILSAALGKASRTEYEDVLLVASRWLGRGVVVTNNAEKVLNLTVALERLVCGDKRENITDTLAQRMAFLLGTDADSRITAFRRMKKLYGLRSKVVHEGNTDIADEDVAELERLSCVAFIKMAERASEWSEQSQFFDWTLLQTFTIPRDGEETEKQNTLGSGDETSKVEP